jgi:hypothetical protein
MTKVKVGPDVEKDLVALDLEVRDAAIWTMRAMTAKRSLGHGVVPSPPPQSCKHVNGILLLNLNE